MKFEVVGCNVLQNRCKKMNVMYLQVSILKNIPTNEKKISLFVHSKD
ncbi:hypothetical protein FHS57_006209 [Runella defluvii]|uniref:Uncharacterized protein n=1 Tax=Runella defluvii TaxID=370973 RepID=A0A7W5ZR91_9BACT|nr:hypothetical protein [Runella defluvii]